MNGGVNEYQIIRGKENSLGFEIICKLCAVLLSERLQINGQQENIFQGCVLFGQHGIKKKKKINDFS